MSLVVDSSVTLAWMYPDERTDAVLRVLERVGADGAWVPSLWHLEVANALEMGVRRQRRPASFRDAMLADLMQLPISVDPETDRHAWTTALELAARHRLTLYDSAYLELALRRGLPLATLGAALRSAATSEGVRLLGT